MKEERKQWNAKQKRCYHRLRSMLAYWEGNGYQLLRVDLTSSNDSKSEDLRKNFRKLRRKVESVFKFDDIEDFVIETSEGNGVLHMIWAWKPKKGYRNRTFYIPHKWLERNWQAIHKAKIVWVAKYDQSSSRSRQRVSGYMVSQYLAGHKSQLVRYSYSWRRTIGFPLVAFWKLFKQYWLYYAQVEYWEMLDLWEMFLQGQRLPDLVEKGKWFMTIDEMRGIKIV